MTVDLEDYRRQELRDHLGGREAPPNPREVDKQLNRVLALLDACRARATFFAVGRLTSELDASVWARITARHELGCHGHEHLRVAELGAERFRADLIAARRALEDVSGAPVTAYRAPYFSSDGCDPWYGEALAEAGFRIDASRRLRTPPARFSGTLPLPGSGGAVRSIPFPCVGFGEKRLTVIGGTYFRALPLDVIRKLLARAEAAGFVPMIYLQPYDIDPRAPPLRYPGGYLRRRAGDTLRRIGRATAADKLRALAADYDFAPAGVLAL